MQVREILWFKCVRFVVGRKFRIAAYELFDLECMNVDITLC